MNLKKFKLYFFLIIFQILNIKLGYTSIDIKLKKSCIINSYNHIYKTEKASEEKLQKSIKRTTCSKKINLMFLNLLKSAQGSFTTRNFQKLYLPKDLGVKVIIKPSQIKISSFIKILKQLQLPNNIFLKELSSDNKFSILTLEKNDQISLSCEDCSSPGKKTILVKVKNFEKNVSYSVPIELTLLTRSQIIIPKKNIDYFNNKKLFKSDFSKKWIETTFPGKYFKSFDKIIFFKPTKTLKKGAPILKRDLIPIKLVRPFTPVKIILSNKGIKLSGIAIAKKGGHYGEVIPLKNKKGKRVIFGKIIDFNKVNIEI
ncbi:MAG: hypothetical protein CME68_02325 [Halobacteriovoraceae bacterium]|nr:hypothetical protein [Halobacteriovoraceae bacterium]